ncbi:MAG: type II toxin-antitoxin system VapB family antitoxin [Candidatus Symbiothrix sp.]|jgi:Arc/MetJ family transcription regulator|nr:type II toxin-antitoxin system VapB family antitoxin [Candidatus Symbiothrix sp.]
MQTNIIINNKLVEEAFRYSRNISTERELIEIALKEYVISRKQKSIKELRGKIKFREDYDYKLMREI